MGARALAGRSRLRAVVRLKTQPTQVGYLHVEARSPTGTSPTHAGLKSCWPRHAEDAVTAFIRREACLPMKRNN